MPCSKVAVCARTRARPPGFRASSASISYQGSAVPGRVNLVSGNYFHVLGLKPTIGRLFTEDDKLVLREVELELLRAVSPAYRHGADAGRIEISTSPSRCCRPYPVYPVFSSFLHPPTP